MVWQNERKREEFLCTIYRGEKKKTEVKSKQKKEEKATRLATLSLGQIVKGSIHSSLSSLHPVLYHIHVRDCNKNAIFFFQIIPQSYRNPCSTCLLYFRHHDMHIKFGIRIIHFS